jgi:hypothetical protein
MPFNSRDQIKIAGNNSTFDPPLLGMNNGRS